MSFMDRTKKEVYVMKKEKKETREKEEKVAEELFKKAHLGIT